MATKPGLQLPEWASNANYATGPKAGTPTKVAIPGAIAQDGHRPGKVAPTAAQHWNDWLNLLSKWVEWVRQGSSAGAANAHIVEADADGRFQIEGITIAPANAAAFALSVASPPGAAGSAIIAQGGGAFGDPVLYVAATGGSSSAAQFVNTGSSAETLVVSGNGTTGTAIKATGNPALSAIGSGTQPAITAQGSASSLHAVSLFSNNASGNVLLVTGSASAAHAARIVAGANSVGLKVLGGSTSGAAVDAEAQANSQHGVHGKTTALATTSARAVFGEAFNAGVGVYGSSEDGYPLRGVTVNNTRGQLLLSGHATDPSNGDPGALAHNTADGMVKHYISAAWCGLMWRLKGSAGEVKDSAGDETSNDNSDPVPIITRALTAHQAPKVTGKVVIRIDLRIGRTGTCRIGFELVDVTAGSNVQTWNLPLYQSGAGVYEREATLSAVATLPATGNRTYRLDMYRIGGGGGDLVRCTDVVMTVDGVFEG